MQDNLITFFKQNPSYADVDSDRFMEGMTRARKFFPRSRITDYLFGRKRIKKTNIVSDPLYDIVLKDPYVSEHLELLPKIRSLVRDKCNGIKKPYGHYSLPKRSKIASVYKLIRSLTYKLHVEVKSVKIEKSYPIKLVVMSKKENIVLVKEEKHYDVSNASLKRISHETQCHLWPGDDLPSELIKKPIKEEEFDESKLRLIFEYCLDMKEKKYKLPVSIFVPLREYLDDFLIEMLKEIYGMRALVDAGVCDDILLIIGGIEPNPGPRCTLCQDDYNESLIWGQCPRCMPGPYYTLVSKNRDLIVAQAKERGLRCISCYYDFEYEIEDESVLFLCWLISKCFVCSYYYTYSSYKGYVSPYAKSVLQYCKQQNNNKLSREEIYRCSPHFRIVNSLRFPQEYKENVHAILKYIHPYVYLKTQQNLYVLHMKGDSFIVSCSGVNWTLGFNKRSYYLQGVDLFSEINRIVILFSLESDELRAIFRDIHKMDLSKNEDLRYGKVSPNL